MDNDSSAMACANAGKGFWARRIVDANEAIKDKVLFKFLAIRDNIACKFRFLDDTTVHFMGQGQDAKALTGESLHIDVDIPTSLGS
jgi:hypothetical protein